MNNSLRSLFIEGVSEKQFVPRGKRARNSLFVLGGNEFHLRVLVCDAKS